jgi:fatty-acid desaturase
MGVSPKSFRSALPAGYAYQLAMLPRMKAPMTHAHKPLAAEAVRDPAQVLITMPWKRPWWYCAPGESMTLLWIILIHVAAVVGLLCLPFPGWPIIGVAIGLLWLGGLGTTIAYHRSLAHRSVVLHPIVERVLIFFAMFNGSGSPAHWVADHRHHHAMADKTGDISSPREGFWWAHLRWLWQANRENTKRFSQDMETSAYRWWRRLQIPILLGALVGGLILVPWLGWPLALAAALWLGPIRLLMALHVQCTVNSVCHLGAMSKEQGSAQNVWWLTLVHMGQGENWHGNHHHWQNSPRLGYGFSQIDLGWWVIRFLAWCGLANKVKSTGIERSGHLPTTSPHARLASIPLRSYRALRRWISLLLLWLGQPHSA